MLLQRSLLTILKTTGPVSVDSTNSLALSTARAPYSTPTHSPEATPKSLLRTTRNTIQKGLGITPTPFQDNTVKHLKSHFKSHADKPFFHYVAYTSAHWPMHALPQDIAKYDGNYDGGYAPTYQARLKKMKQLGLIDSKWEIPRTRG